MSKKETRERLLDAAEIIIRRASRPEDVSVRRIAAIADTNVSAISYHFASLEGLAVACAARTYHSVNLARLAELQQAIDAARPAPPEIRQIVRALIGTSVRWSLDPTSPYAVFNYLSHLTSLPAHKEAFDGIVHDVKHHMIFVQFLHKAAPWFSEEQIRWRLTAALGVRSQFTRQPQRAEVLTGTALSGDPEPIIDTLCEIIAGMFQRPANTHPARTSPHRAYSNTV